MYDIVFTKLEYKKQEDLKTKMIDTVLINEEDYLRLLNKKQKYSKTDRLKITKYELNKYYNNNIPYTKLFQYRECIKLEMLKSGSYKTKYIKDKIEVTEHSQSNTKMNYHFKITNTQKIRLYKIDNNYKPYNPNLKLNLLLSQKNKNIINIENFILDYLDEKDKLNMLLSNNLGIIKLLTTISRINYLEELKKKSKLLFIPKLNLI